MRLLELFSDEVDIEGEIRKTALNFLTPYLANGVSKVSIKSVMRELQSYHFGIEINKATVLSALNPTAVPVVQKIEGDFIYIGLPEPEPKKDGMDAEMKKKEHIDKAAKQQASKDILKK